MTIIENLYVTEILKSIAYHNHMQLYFKKYEKKYKRTDLMGKNKHHQWANPAMPRSKMRK